MGLFICYEKCSTCKKAQKFLDDNNTLYELRAIKEQNPTAEELKQWHKISGLPLKRFFNTSGQLYRGMELSKKLPEMSEDEQYEILASDGMLVKRPLFIDGDTVLVGFKEAEWSEKLK
ncbi:MAG TPA: arsenate reductase family protein [Candidatus Butyricicoccus avistercoris]|uniref:Arsenate reductase family protein n=1 Tax=Candidatus Butyricicoccus avistercoris TaxID=2838518 RepID=A0A9D1PJP7_9FIRM|nr:arsenate reductase family protein [Candidatus Butyricicoccus avistercoris]